MSLPELSDEQYQALGVMPMSRFPAQHRALINDWVSSEYAPPRWAEGEFCRSETRAWFEWHVRRSGDPRKKRPGIPKILRGLVVKRDGMTCKLCGQHIASVRDLHVDHIVPWSLGGPTTLANLQVAHARCNIRKGARPLAAETR